MNLPFLSAWEETWEQGSILSLECCPISSDDCCYHRRVQICCFESYTQWREIDGSIPLSVFLLCSLHTLLPFIFCDEWLIRKIIICKLWVNQTFGLACREMEPLSRCSLQPVHQSSTIPRPVMNLHEVSFQHVNDCYSKVSGKKY